MEMSIYGVIVDIGTTFYYRVWSIISKFLRIKSTKEIISGKLPLDPFIQPPILHALFEQLPVEELAKCRLVSKLWYNESLSTWRSKATLKIEGNHYPGWKLEFYPDWDDDDEDDTTNEVSTTSLRIREFLDLWDAGDYGSFCPFNKFHLRRWSFDAEDVDQERFLELVGGHIASLTLEECSFEERDHFRRILYQAFPNLQFLNIHRCEVDDVYWYEPSKDIQEFEETCFGVHPLKSLVISYCLPDSMMIMLSHFNEIKSLRMWPQDHRHIEIYCYSLVAIKKIREQDETKLPLKNFDVTFMFEFGENTVYPYHLLDLHEELNLPLQRLEIFGKMDLNSKEEDENVLQGMLQYHSATLKYLEFRVDSNYWLNETFPSGINLESLEVLVIKSPRISNNFNYFSNMPNLRVLEIKDNSLSMAEWDNVFFNSSQLEIGDWALTSLTVLRLKLPLSESSLIKLMKWMPNVERLTVKELDDVKFSMVCENWKHLKDLRDCGSMLTDEGVIGIKNVNWWWWWKATDVPNIAQLKNLTSFETRSSKLTSASVHEGFLKSANLKWIYLNDETELDDEAKTALEKQEIKYTFTDEFVSFLLDF